MSDRRNVTGVWYGRWTSPTPRVRPNSFIATLVEAHARISGSISERDLAGPGIIGADVGGARAGGRLEFIKQYNGGRLSHAVHYAGTINAAGTEVSGSWRLGTYSGGFAMTREIFDDLDVDEEEEVRKRDEAIVR
jgi:hypothetical protein